MGQKERRMAQTLNTETYNNYYTRLRLLAVSRFEWINLPPTVDERFLEKCLCDDGKAIFFNDPEIGGYYALHCTYGGALNVYENPLEYVAWSINYNNTFPFDQCVRIRNNYLDLSTNFSLSLFAKRLANAERACDVNIEQQKTPILITGDESQRLTLQNIYKDREDNVPAIFGDKKLIPNEWKVLKTDAPYVADKLRDYIHSIWNEALTFLGIESNPMPDKKERQITNEVDSNNALTDLSAKTMLLSRQKACDEINKMFNLDISVKMRELDKQDNSIEEDSDDE